MVIKKTFFLCLLLLQGFAHSQTLLPYKNPLLPADVRAKDLIIRMTPEEKFWQCFMLSESWELPKERYSSGVFGFEGGATETTGNAQNKLISIENNGSAANLVQRINEAQHFFMEKTRLGIPIIPYAEALHGLIREGATVFPQSIGLSATFDTSLMHRISRAIAEETRKCGIRMVLSPVVNISNDPRWGRTEETYGEDPYLSSAMGIAFVSELEKAGIITCPKHFVANYGDGGRDSYPVHLDERMLDEVYLPPFKNCIQKGGSWSVMAAYNSLSGVPCTADNWLLNNKLKKEWNFEGIVVSDAGATGGSNCLHMTAKDYHESTVDAMNNGLDVIFQTNFDHYTLFMPPFLDGSIRNTAIDSAVYRVLKAKFQLGLFDEPYVGIKKSENAFGDPAHIALALEAARESIVLLKNENNTLPFSKTIKKIAVIGPDAVEARLGGYSGDGYKKVSILEGIQSLINRSQGREGGKPAEVVYAPGCGRQNKEYVVVPPEVFTTPENGKVMKGLKAEYFNNIDLSGTPVLSRTDKNIDFRWTLYSPDPAINYDWFSVRWTGKITAPATGKYRIGIQGNDGYRLYINDSLLIDNWQKTSNNTTMKEYFFVKGKDYPVRLEFHETSGSVWLRLVWDQGIKDNWEEEINKAMNTARQSDAIVVVAGIEEGEGLDRAFLNLPGKQEEMILKLASLNKPLVVVLSGGSAITMQHWLGQVPAVIDSWYPGEQGGNAVADVLFGEYNPAGRLPITFPMTEGQVPLYYYHKPTGRNDDYADITGEALFPFGYGLSYTQFQYSNLAIDRTRIKSDESVGVSFTIKNIGDCAGDEVVQLYIKDIYASVARPLKELKAFDRIHLAAGEHKKITMTITPEMLTMLDINLKPVVEAGDFRILIGASSKDIRLRGTLTVLP